MEILGAGNYWGYKGEINLSLACQFCQTQQQNAQNNLPYDIIQ